MFGFNLRSLGPVTIFFGLPRSGKTTFCAYLVHKMRRKGLVYSNTPIIGSIPYDARSELGTAAFQSGSLIILDEAGLEFNNRNFGKFSDATIRFMKLIGHYKCRMVIFSQSYDDMDITFRRLASSYYLVTRSVFPGFTLIKKVYRKIGVDDNDHTIKDLYFEDKPFLAFFRAGRIFRPFYYKLFDSYRAPELPLDISDREPYDYI